MASNKDKKMINIREAEPENGFELDLNEDYSLEAILAEYKGSAYIAGDKRTPQRVLNERTERIILEETGRHPIVSAELRSNWADAVGKPEKKISIRYDEPSSDAGMEDTVRIDTIVPHVLREEKREAKKAVPPQRPELKKSSPREERGAERFLHLVDKQDAAEDRRKEKEAERGERKNSNYPMTERSEDMGQGGRRPEPSVQKRQEPVKMYPAEVELPKQKGSSRGTADTMKSAAQVAPTAPIVPPAPEARNVNITGFTDSDEEFFNAFQTAVKNAPQKYGNEVDSAIAEQEELDNSLLGEDGETLLGGIFHRIRENRSQRAEIKAQEQLILQEAREAEEKELLEKEKEPDLLEVSKRYASGLHSLTIRENVAFLLSLVMLIFTYIGSAGKSLPFGIGKSIPLATGVLAIMLLFVAALGYDVLISGVRDLIHGEPGAESLVFASCLFSVIDSLYAIRNYSITHAIPFCAVSAFSLTLAMRGKKLYKESMRNTLRVAVSASKPYGVISDYGNIEERAILKKVTSATRGFYIKLTQMDICESAYSYTAPMLLIGTLVLTGLATLVKHNTEFITYSLSSMTAIAASFSAALAYNLPFRIVSSNAKHAGAAIAGWGGACEIYDSDGALITDEDLFPKGTVAFESIKVFEGVSEHKAIAFTSSIIAASGSGLSKLFGELLKSKGISMERVDDFACYEGGGVSGTVRGERVMVGSTGFMNLMGIRVPDSLNTKTAVFCSVNDMLIAAFTVNYIPANSVQSAIVTLLKTRVSMLFAVRDFNVTPAMVKKRFKLTMDGIEYIPVEDCYRISDDKLPEGCDTVAVLCREGLGPFGEAIARGRQLKIIAELATAVSVIGSVFGVLMMFYLCWNGSFAAASAGNVLTYMIVTYFAVTLLARLAARRS